MPKKRKSSPGVCDKCGRAVVRPIEWGTTGSGHTFEDGRLVSVLCFEHAPWHEWGDLLAGKM